MLYFIVLYFLLIILFSLIKFKEIKSPTLNLFKSMFPSWKFFDESNDTPVLLYREADDWKICFSPPKLQWWHFFYNPAGNFYLAYHSHLQQVLGELTVASVEEATRFQDNLSYKMLEHFVRSKSPQSDFQFKISSIKKAPNGFAIIEDILISPKLKVEIV